MSRVIVIVFLLLIIACSDTTGPSFQQYSLVSVIDTSTGSIITHIELSPTFNRNICLTPDGRYAYIAAWDGDNVIQIDCLSYSISGGLDFGTYRDCMDLCTNDQGTELYAISDDELFIVEIPSLTIADTVQLNTSFVLSVLHRPGTDLIYVPFIRLSSTGTFVIDVAQGEITDTLSHVAMYPAFSETGNELYIADGTQLICLDPDTDEELASVDLNNQISDICVITCSNTMYVSWRTLWVEGGVIALDRNTLVITNSLDLAFEVENLCYVPVLDILYIGYRADFHDDRIMVADLPNLDTLDDIQISPNLINMVSDPSGDYVYCNIHMDDRIGSLSLPHPFFHK